MVAFVFGSVPSLNVWRTSNANWRVNGCADMRRYSSGVGMRVRSDIRLRDISGARRVREEWSSSGVRKNVGVWRAVADATGVESDGLLVKATPMPDSSLRLDVQVSGEETQKVFDQLVAKLAKSATIPGFRKGEAPKHVVISRMGRKNLILDTCEKVISEFSNKAMERQEARVIGQADLQDDVQKVIDGFSPGEPLEFAIKVDIWPEPTLNGDYKSIHVKIPEEKLDENLVDKALEELRKRESTTVDIDDANATLALGMVASVDMTAYQRNEDGSMGERISISDVEETGVTMEITEGKYFPGLIEGVIGMKAGETRAVPVDMPENVARAELRGLKVIFEITLRKLADKVLPALDDQFAQTVSEKNTLEELRVDIEERLKVETGNLADQKLLRAVEDQLLDMIEVDLPETLVEEQTKQKFAAMMSDFAEKGMTEEQVKSMITKEGYEVYKKNARKNVIRSLRSSFAFSEIAKKEGISVSPEEVEDQLALVRAELKGQEIDEDRARERIEAQLEKDKVLELLKATISIETVNEEKTD
eukprot:CAMPEP_0184691072 /NCGR_PEP_ID=MMETSP0312-20130426/31615_1 /TAXON_ID=31354 /ORGANISM="Compsopogon coeruleus, Strain SAG 36.94" /LENGTH=534 /DNA_ID=CAMNT_0027148707 /DNA_START=108 /DNA_END=1712 /DNA_ORIENTATION=+